jgi:CheY-like chemotaxis protein
MNGQSAAHPILVVDDDHLIRQTVVEILVDEGYTVLSAANGAAAMDLLTGAQGQPPLRPAVILLDMRMPVMDGWQFCDAYRRLAGPLAPVAVMTAAQDASRWAADVTADAYLSKPFDLMELLDTVVRLSEMPHQESVSSQSAPAAANQRAA